ncbi:MAG TPA: YezD family protein [Opitutaceae bacterium]
MNSATETKTATLLPEWLEIVREKVESLRYGVVQIVVHDARVTQIERTEKTRLGGPRDSSE